MSNNTLILNAGASAPDKAAAKAAQAGEDLGLVQTSIAFEDEKVSGGRIEEEREFGGVTFEAFDEPVFIGSAIAQLSGHVDVVVVDALDTWAERLLQRFPNDPVALDAEVLSLVSVMKARMADMVVIAQADRAELGDEARALIEKIVDQVRPLCDDVVD